MYAETQLQNIYRFQYTEIKLNAFWRLQIAYSFTN